MNEINWGSVREEATRHLQELLRIDTSNPPGNELPAAEYLAGVLRQEGVSPLVLTSGSQRATVVTRLGSSGAQAPLMLLGHLDVVPAVPEQWSHPPFGGDVADGFLWGRGAIDCKGLVVADLMVTLLCRRLGLPLKGDLVWMAHADEESSEFACGMSWLVREHRDLFDAPFALYEGGGEEFEIESSRFMPVTSAEKGWCTVDVTTRGQGGHSSVPHPDNPLFHMAPILLRLRAAKMPVHMVETVACFFDGLRETLERDRSEMGRRLRRIVDPGTSAAALESLVLEDQRHAWFEALLRNTAAPTMMAGSNSEWALPAEAHLTLNGRILPGQSMEDFERELQEVLGTGVDYRIRGFREGTECEIDTPVTDSIRRVMARRTPDLSVIPAMMTGGTERGLLNDVGVQCYGFWPRRAEPGVPPGKALCHGVDERVSLDNLLFGIRCLFEVVCDLNGIDGQPGDPAGH